MKLYTKMSPAKITHEFATQLNAGISPALPV